MNAVYIFRLLKRIIITQMIVCVVFFSGPASRVLAEDCGPGDSCTGFADTYTGSTNDDGSESDPINGLDGDDTMYGNEGNDVLSGDGGNDTLYGGDGDNRLYGNDGDDTFWGGSGDDFMQGGAGNNTYEGGGSMNGGDFVSYEDSAQGVQVTLETGSANHSDGVQTYTDAISNVNGVIGSTNDDELTSSVNGAVGLWGGDGDDILTTLGGDNTLSGGAGDDTLTGGDGTDMADYSSAPNAVTVNLNTGIATGEGTDTLSGIDLVNGSAYNDTIIGGNGFAIINGGAGNDVLDGSYGDGVIVDYGGAPGGVTVDLSNGSPQNTGYGWDTLIDINDLVATSSDDILTGNDGDNTIDGMGGNDYINGGAGVDTINYWWSPEGVSVDLRITGLQEVTPGTYNTLLNIESVLGSYYPDTLIGNEYDNILDGQGTDGDIIIGGGGFDYSSYMEYYTGININLLTGMVTDYTPLTLMSMKSAAPEAMAFAPRALSGSGPSLDGIEGVYGTSYADIIVGNNEDNRLYGEGGDDRVTGGLGGDYMDGGDGYDTAVEDGADPLTYQVTSAGITTNSGDTLLNFEEIQGGTGDDSFAFTGNGISGSFSGGSGNNTYYFSSGAAGSFNISSDGSGTLDFSNFGSRVSINPNSTSPQQIVNGLTITLNNTLWKVINWFTGGGSSGKKQITQPSEAQVSTQVLYKASDGSNMYSVDPAAGLFKSLEGPSNLPDGYQFAGAAIQTIFKSGGQPIGKTDKPVTVVFQLPADFVSQPDKALTALWFDPTANVWVELPVKLVAGQAVIQSLYPGSFALAWK